MNGKTPEAVVIVPAFNEEESIVLVLAGIRECAPGMEIVVVNDGSTDRTAAIARGEGATVLDLPCNLGVGEAVQAGFQYAFEQGCQYAVRCDADGQHDPADIFRLLAAIRGSEVDLVVGSRFLGERQYASSLVRSLGISGLCAILSRICRKRVTDPTSGFQALNRPLLYYFSKYYPKDYPEPEALALLRRQGYDFMEVPATFRPRLAGTSTIRSWGTLYYTFKVFLALLVDRARPVDVKYARWNVGDKI